MLSPLYHSHIIIGSTNGGDFIIRSVTSVVIFISQDSLLVTIIIGSLLNCQLRTCQVSYLQETEATAFIYTVSADRNHT